MTPPRQRPKRWTGKAWAYWLKGARRWMFDSDSNGKRRGDSLPTMEAHITDSYRKRPAGWVRVRVTITPLTPKRRAVKRT